MDLSRFSLEGRVALVTGAGGVLGMGRATALAFAGAGADVAVTDLIVKAENWDLEGTAEEVRKLGRRAIAVQADVTKEGDIANLVKKTVQEFGTIDVLANVAGIPANAPLMQMTRRPGLARAAPIAAGRPKPMVPRPPEVRRVLGAVTG